MGGELSEEETGATSRNWQRRIKKNELQKKNVAGELSEEEQERLRATGRGGLIPDVESLVRRY
jgi:hypothetical protein